MLRMGNTSQIQPNRLISAKSNTFFMLGTNQMPSHIPYLVLTTTTWSRCYYQQSYMHVDIKKQDTNSVCIDSVYDGGNLKMGQYTCIKVLQRKGVFTVFSL